jgi:hypothetical protein
MELVKIEIFIKSCMEYSELPFCMIFGTPLYSWNALKIVYCKFYGRKWVILWVPSIFTQFSQKCFMEYSGLPFCTIFGTSLYALKIIFCNLHGRKWVILRVPSIFSQFSQKCCMEYSGLPFCMIFGTPLYTWNALKTIFCNGGKWVIFWVPSIFSQFSQFLFDIQKSKIKSFTRIHV